MNAVELQSMNVLISKMNKKQFYIISIPCEITDRRTGCKCTDYLYEFVAKHEDFEIDNAYERMKKKAEFLGCDISMVGDDVTWAKKEMCMDSVFDEGEQDE